MHVAWAKCSSVTQSYCSSPLAFCAMTVLRWITRKAFSTVIAFSSPQAWPRGWLEPPSWGTRSLRALRWLGEQGCSPRQEHTVSSGPFGGHSFQLILSKLSITCARAPQTCSEQNKKARGKTEWNEPFCSLVGVLPRVWLGSLPTMWRLWMMSRRKGRSQPEDDLNSGLMSFSAFAHHVFSQSKLECFW